MKKSLILFHDLESVLDLLTNEEAGALIKAVFAYDIHGEVIDFEDRMLQSSYTRIIECLDRNSERYEKTIERRKAAALKRWGKTEESPA